MLKIRVQKARVHVTMRNKQEGSVLQGTAKAGCLGIETRLDIESDEPWDRIATLVRTAENGCFSMQALLAPVRVATAAALNGKPLDAGRQ